MTPEAPSSIVDRYLRRPHLVTSLVLLAAVVGSSATAACR